MRSAFDRRVLPDPVLGLVRACQRRVPAHLAGGAGLSGAYLAHRLSGDVDLPVRPLPMMLVPLTETELRAFRDALRDRFRRLAVPQVP